MFINFITIQIFFNVPLLHPNVEIFGKCEDVLTFIKNAYIHHIKFSFIRFYAENILTYISNISKL